MGKCEDEMRRYTQDQSEMIKAIWELGIECSEEEALDTYYEIVG